MPLLSHKVVDPAGTPIADALVSVRLVTSTTDPHAPGYRNSADETIVFSHDETAGSDGTATMTLPGNADLAPGGSYYEATISSGGAVLYGPVAFEMPTSGGPYSLYDLLVTPPTDLPDASGTWTPVGTSNNGTGTVNATWQGRWVMQSNKSVLLAVKGIVTSGWSGVDVLEVSLPAWFAAVDVWEQYGVGAIIPRPVVFGIHYPIHAVIHPADDADQQSPPVIRMITPQENPGSNNGRWWAVDGITYPAALTADDTIDFTIVAMFA